MLTRVYSRVISNFVAVANVKDIVNDTVISLKKGPKRHVAVDDFLDVPKDQQLKRGLTILSCH
jgi:hypothetical protein